MPIVKPRTIGVSCYAYYWTVSGRGTLEVYTVLVMGWHTPGLTVLVSGRGDYRISVGDPDYTCIIDYVPPQRNGPKSEDSRTT